MQRDNSNSNKVTYKSIRERLSEIEFPAYENLHGELGCFFCGEWFLSMDDSQALENHDEDCLWREANQDDRITLEDAIDEFQLSINHSEQGLYDNLDIPRIKNTIAHVDIFESGRCTVYVDAEIDIDNMYDLGELIRLLGGAS